MLATNKWRLLTIVAGLLWANAIDSPLANSPRALTQQQQQPYQIQPQTLSSPDGVTLQHFYPPAAAVATNRNGRSSTAATRNLYQPYNVFSNVDNIRFTANKRVSNNRAERQLFGSFRYGNNSAKRRSDSLPEINSSLPVQGPRRSKAKSPYSFIPLNQFKDPDSPANTLTLRPNTSINNATIQDGIQSRTDTNLYPPEESTSTRSKIVFPNDSNNRNQHDITGRRSGIQFTAQSLKLENPFQPQGYREDNPSSPNYQFPYVEELSFGGSETDAQYARGPPIEQARVPSTIQQQISTNSKIAFRDEVTKFGDINGPITSLQHRQFNDLSDNKPFTIRPYDAFSSGYYTSSYDEFSRSPRYNSPPPNKVVDYSDYPGPPRSRLINPWKSSRTPRVVFPQNTGEGGSFPTGAGAIATGGTYSSDNVVFR